MIDVFFLIMKKKDDFFSSKKIGMKNRFYYRIW